MSGPADLARLSATIDTANELMLTDEIKMMDVGDGVMRPTNAKAIADLATQMNGAMVYASVSLGLTGTVDGGYFSVPSSSDAEYLILYRNSVGSAVEVERYPSASAVTEISDRVEGVEQIPSTNGVFAIQDDAGNAAINIRGDGVVEIPSLRPEEIEAAAGGTKPVFGVTDDIGRMAISVDATGGVAIPDLQTEKLSAPQFDLLRSPQPQIAFAFADENGYAAFGMMDDGTPFGSILDAMSWQELTIGTDDTIAHIGDSYTAAHYVLKDKAYISQLSQLSPYRHAGFAVSGNDLLDMQYRIVNGDTSTGMTLRNIKAKYAFLTSLTNDAQFRNVDQSFYAENYRRLIDTVRALGTEPVITTEFPATSVEHALLSGVADEMGCAFVDCTSYDAEIGGLQAGPFQQDKGHPGTRTGGVFWQPMLDFIDRMPRPEKAIKIYRKRSTFTSNGIADLLYKDRLDRAKKWKELSVFHYALTTPERFEELDHLGTQGVDWGYAAQADEYLKLQKGEPVAFTDYTLIELTLPGDSGSLESVDIRLIADAAPNLYVRNNLDVSASMPGKIQGSTPTNPTYLSRWDKPRGAWASLGSLRSSVMLSRSDLSLTMVGRKLTLLLEGAFNLSNLKVRWKGAARNSDLRPVRKRNVVGPNLLTNQVCGTPQQLTGWITAGSPQLVVPIDRYNAPRLPGTTTPIDGVVTITSANTIGQSVVLPVDGGLPRRYRLTVWARYFPKAFIDPSVYPSLDAGQVIDRIQNPSASPITPDTLDLRTLKCEMWTGGQYPASGGCEQLGFASLQWRPIEFEFDAAPYRTGSTFNFTLSCLDGSIQVAKAHFTEIEKWA